MTYKLALSIRFFSQIRRDMGKTINKNKNQVSIPPLTRGQWNIYRPEDIKRWGPQRFLEEVCVKEPFLIPNLSFSEEENQRMDQILKEERAAKDNDI
ncbi:hypothetical protein Q0590_36325 [Rhodocytophaga aerolata]|uniref:Uncharacterized protein n=1 Tax=Rhodocytophaga aerolata TaxID=455078 RepID=A0ABT8RKB0_9BACT|nr:hypothetical protein [Rhodocytophaga aerolata]MDO1451798.1 hypothetical protein [Rhodocytophaga aerolata]